MTSRWVGLASRLVLGASGFVAGACGGPRAAAPPVASSPSVAAAPGPTPVLASAPAQAHALEQVFAPAAPAPAFTDLDRRAKLAAAFPAIEKALEEERTQQGVPGVAVGIVIDGELAYAKGFGVVDPATKAVPDADTVYRIGSITKSFTGL